MCGIFGEILFEGGIDPSVSFKKLNLMAHRGPDGFGFEYGDFKNGSSELFHNIDIKNVKKNGSNINYFLGHRRLSINDLSSLASQPMRSFDKRHSITFNGEIYNFLELKRELEQMGCPFKTDHSDTEVLLNAYSVWGEDCLGKLNGMFAFAILDREDRSLFIARDRIGEKPLYYEWTGSKFVFSSEISSLIQFNDTLREIDLTGLAQYLVFGYVPHPFSIFKGIKKLSPGSYLKLDLRRGKILLKKYWDLSLVENKSNTKKILTNQVEEVLSDSVKLRLRADVPIGAFVSGGIDSTLVIKKIKEIRGEATDVFGADFPGSNLSEKKYIEEASLKYGHHLNLIPINLEKSNNLKKVIGVFDEPFDGGSALAVFELFKEVRKKYKVILTGDGGDELFAGYPRYKEFSKKNGLANQIKRLSLLKGPLKYLSGLKNSPQKLTRLMEFISSDRISNYLNMRYDFKLINMLKRKDEIGEFDAIREVASEIKDKKISDIKAAQYLEFKTILPGRMLYKIDRFSMHYGVEARTPFLDHNLAELAFSIPDNFNQGNKNTKIILKKILKSDFPSSFIDRRKQGFGNPLDSWFRGSEMKSIMKDLNNSNSAIFNYLDFEKIQKEYPEIREGYDGRRPTELWRLAVLGQFLENMKDHIKFA